MFDIWNRRYTGSKYKLSSWISELIAEKLSALTDVDRKKLYFILTREENRDYSLNYGLNFSALVYLKIVTGLDYPYLFSGK